MNCLTHKAKSEGVSFRFMLFCYVSFHFVSFFVSFRFVFCFVSFHFILFCFLFVSFRFVLFIGNSQSYFNLLDCAHIGKIFWHCFVLSTIKYTKNYFKRNWKKGKL
jgi:hypothetical protein